MEDTFIFNQVRYPPVVWDRERPEWFGEFVASKTRVGIKQPFEPWEDVDWVSFRTTMVAQHVKWLVDQNLEYAKDFWYSFDKFDHRVVYLFSDSSHALIFKLRWAGQ